MIGFFIKKNFCDGWDNMLWTICFNIIGAAIVVATYVGLGYILELEGLVPTAAVMLFSLLFALAGLFMLNCLQFSVSRQAYKITCFASNEFKPVFSDFFKDWKIALQFSLLIVFIVVISVFVLPFYWNLGNMIGLLLASILAWGLLITLISLQWFIPLETQLKGGFKKTLKKCFLLFFDNTGFSLFLTLYNLILCAMTPFLAFLMPSFTGLIMAENNALRLRLYKYDWLEKNPDIPIKEAKKQIPWDELLAEDRETIGPRTFKSFIFPWKD